MEFQKQPYHFGHEGIDKKNIFLPGLFLWKNVFFYFKEKFHRFKLIIHPIEIHNQTYLVSILWSYFGDQTPLSIYSSSIDLSHQSIIMKTLNLNETND